MFSHEKNDLWHLDKVLMQYNDYHLNFEYEENLYEAYMVGRIDLQMGENDDDNEFHHEENNSGHY